MRSYEIDCAVMDCHYMDDDGCSLYGIEVEQVIFGDVAVAVCASFKPDFDGRGGEKSE